MGSITLPAIQWETAPPELRSRVDTTPLPHDWTWTQIILIDAGLVLTASYLTLSPIIQVLTKFTDEGIQQPGLLRNKIIHWQDIQKIYNTTTDNIEIRDSKTKVQLIPSLFVNPPALRKELHLRAPASAFSTIQQVSQKVKQHKRNHLGRMALGATSVSIFIFTFGQTVVSFAIGTLLLGYGIFEFEKWLKLDRHS
jgi:hypothetical protein